MRRHVVTPKVSKTRCGCGPDASSGRIASAPCPGVGVECGEPVDCRARNASVPHVDPRQSRRMYTPLDGSLGPQNRVYGGLTGIARNIWIDGAARWLHRRGPSCRRCPQSAPCGETARVWAVVRNRRLTPRNRRESMPYHADQRPICALDNTRCNWNTRFAVSTPTTVLKVFILDPPVCPRRACTSHLAL